MLKRWENFPVSGQTLPKIFWQSYTLIKRSAAIANMKTGKLDPEIGEAIVKACDEILKGKFSKKFVVDVFQAGAGTSTNMNLNDVIANRASQILGRKVHPNDHVNMSQSTNDTFHSAIHIAAYLSVKEKLLPALETYEKILQKKVKKFSNIIKTGRTHLMDAVPLTLGQEFSGYTILRRIELLKKVSENLLFLPLGGTAVGTGLTASKNFASMTIQELRKETGCHFQREKLRFAAMQNLNLEVEVSGALRALAVNLTKVSNDIRLLSSSAIGEIILPKVQAGSSMMPGKINPSVPEMLNMVLFQVIGNDTAIMLAAQSGQLEVNVFMPVVTNNLLNSIEILANAVRIFSTKCLAGIKPNLKRILENLEKNPMIATALVPYLGYEKVAEIVQIAQSKNKTIREIVLKEKLIDKKTLDKVLDYKRVVK